MTPLSLLYPSFEFSSSEGWGSTGFHKPEFTVRASSAEPTTLLRARRHQQTAQSHPSEPFPTPTPHNHKHNHIHKTKTGGKEFEGTLKPLSSVSASHPAKKKKNSRSTDDLKITTTSPQNVTTNTGPQTATSQHTFGAPKTNIKAILNNTKTTTPPTTNFTTKQTSNITSSKTFSTPNPVHHRTPNTSRPENTLQQQSQL